MKTENNQILDHFLAISSWQAAVSILLFIMLEVGFWVTLKHWKIQFIYRILLGMGLGLLFGIVIQGILGFSENGIVNQNKIGIVDEGDNPVLNPDYHQWAEQLNIWTQLMGNIFISGIKFLTAPVVFIAIFKVFAKPNVRGLGRISLKGVFLLLINVAVIFSLTFWLGYLFKIGQGINLVPDTNQNVGGTENVIKPLPEIIWKYFPTNLISPWLEIAVIPLMVAGGLFGRSVRILSKRKQEKMDAIRRGMETAWDIVISMLMTFIKIMPLAVLSMIASSVIGNPIGSLFSLGKTIGVAYLAFIISMVWLTFLVAIHGINIKTWWKSAFKVLIHGFATQSSNATLPRSMEILKDEMKIDDKVVSTVTPLSTSMGLMGCAGVQSGILTSLLWTATTNDPSVHQLGLGAFFFLALIITVIASLGIAGVPGTASVVGAGVLGGLGLVAWITPVTTVILSLEGILDMGRTGVNVLAAQAVVPIVAKSEGLIGETSDLLTSGQKARQRAIREKKEHRDHHSSPTVPSSKLPAEPKKIPSTSMTEDKTSD